MLLTAILTATIQGGITGYFWGHGTDLACPGYRYVCDETPPWAAFPSEWFESGEYRCGDVVLVSVGSEKSLLLRALDKCPGCWTFPGGVWDSGLPFVVDLPRLCPWGKIPTQTGIVTNLSLWRRQNTRVQ